mmetsp:Transcript_93843/g.297826  ORF Transcript_93843/g.297826 Transcript_93843/m.297826 type:complete len:251 (+) Transcript_93843:2-754(+)
MATTKARRSSVNPVPSTERVVMPLPALLVVRQLELVQEVGGVGTSLRQGGQEHDEGPVVELTAELAAQVVGVRGLQGLADGQHLPQDILVLRSPAGLDLLDVVQELLHAVAEHDDRVCEAASVLREIGGVPRRRGGRGLRNVVHCDPLRLERVDGVRDLVPFDLALTLLYVRRRVVDLHGKVLRLGGLIGLHPLRVQEQHEGILVGGHLLDLPVQRLVGLPRLPAGGVPAQKLIFGEDLQVLREALLEEL